jgi:hypothetical protein
LARWIEEAPERGRALVQGLANGVKNAAGLLYDAVTNLIQGMLDRIFDLLDMHSPSGVGVEIGENFMSSPILGAQKQLQNVEQYFSQAFERLAMAAVGGLNSPGATSSVQHDQFQFYAPVIMQGSTPPGSLGARLKGRRF